VTHHTRTRVRARQRRPQAPKRARYGPEVTSHRYAYLYHIARDTRQDRDRESESEQ
jgi:hypothetical protein